MSNVQIHELGDSDPITGDEFVPVSQAGLTRRVSVQNMRHISYSSSPGGADDPIWKVELAYTPVGGSGGTSSLLYQFTHVGGILRRTGTLNEWGGHRGTSPYSWGDAAYRGIRWDWDTINQGRYLELEDRRTGRVADIIHGRRWTDGALIRNDIVMNDVIALEEGASVPANLPEGTVIVRYEAGA